MLNTFPTAHQAKRLKAKRSNPMVFAAIVSLAVITLTIYTAPTGSTTAVNGRTQNAAFILESPDRVLRNTLTDLSAEKEATSESTGYQGMPSSCCGKKPAFSDPAYSSVFTGRVAVTTSFAGLGSGFVLEVIDLKNQSLAVPNVNYAPPMYHGPAGAPWTKSKLGNVFGLTLDNQGNIYATASTAYNGDVFPVGATGGEIYKIDGVTGVISVFQTLPNTGHAGLGNINYDCVHNKFYVSNIDDGLIYRLDTNGNILSTWDHGANLTPQISDNSSQPFTPLGRRIWGIQAHNGRLYYGVWWEDQQNINTAHNNEVWSISLDATAGPNLGNFVSPAQQEFSVPALPITGNNRSMPVSDISFGPTGTMLVAERSMTNESNETSPSAHQSSVLEYTLVGSAWTLLNANKFRSNPNRPMSAAGGVDYDFTMPGGLVWSSGDALHYPAPPSVPVETDYIYGIEGTPVTGGDTHNSVLIDLDANTLAVSKTEMGDVEIPCPKEVIQPQTCEVKTKEISCKADGSGGYLYTFTVTNNTGHVVTDILLTPPGNSNIILSDHQFHPTGGLANGASLTLSVTINGGQPQQEACFYVTLMTKEGECCTTRVCPILPECCGLAKEESIECNKDGSYTYVMSIVNTGVNTIEHIYLYPPAGVTMTPGYLAVSLAPGQTFTVKITITGAKPGDKLCFDISLHTAGMKDCCKGQQCIVLPECSIKKP